MNRFSALTVAQQVAYRDLGRKVVSALRKQGVEVVGTGYADTYGMSTVYHLVKDGCMFIRTWAEVQAIAKGVGTLEVAA